MGAANVDAACMLSFLTPERGAWQNHLEDKFVVPTPSASLRAGFSKIAKGGAASFVRDPWNWRAARVGLSRIRRGKVMTS